MTEDYPDELSYHPEHAWARVDDQTATFGITWYAQDNLDRIVFVELPAIGDQLIKDEPYAEVESLKTVADVYAPLSGEVVHVNNELSNNEETINDDPYGHGWLVTVRLADAGQITALLRAEDYRQLVAGSSK